VEGEALPATKGHFIPEPWVTGMTPRGMASPNGIRTRVSALKAHVLVQSQGMTRSGGLATMLRVRAEGFARFAEWESSHLMILTPAAAVAAIGALYQLLPQASRHRPIDTTGVARMHDALRHLSR
jgi:hypothetical protein